MNEKLIQKEVRLREEAVRKFVDVEKLFQKEENARMDFEKNLREDVDARWENFDFFDKKQYISFLYTSKSFCFCGFPPFKNIMEDQ